MKRKRKINFQQGYSSRSVNFYCRILYFVIVQHFIRSKDHFFPRIISTVINYLNDFFSRHLWWLWKKERDCYNRKRARGEDKSVIFRLYSIFDIGLLFVAWCGSSFSNSIFFSFYCKVSVLIFPSVNATKRGKKLYNE